MSIADVQRALGRRYGGSVTSGFRYVLRADAPDGIGPTLAILTVRFDKSGHVASTTISSEPY